MSGKVFYEVPQGAYDTLRVALEQAGLPTSDLDEPGRLFFGLSDDRGIIGYVGLEGDGPDRLLRSLVIFPSRRRLGHGRELVERLEGCVAGVVERLHLLTTTAAPFFRANGYADADRATAPAPIAASREFTALCPASAAYLVKAL
ncbi:arsenic resistance N-acetyltransferase ArsN2 [Sphingomonas lenta]|uniref:arsenic resistance N-acetyltransferase ArsN2 n=1 Tax=Sphingomonas lenta TaxID=1141887 RepID=UPI0026CF0ECF